MARLILSYNGDVINEFEINRGSLSIGRDESSDIHIDNPAVSSKHAKILTILNESFIEDLGSTNGTYINGSQVNGHALQHGESIFIGEHELCYLNRTEMTTAGNDAHVDARTRTDQVNAEQTNSKQTKPQPAGTDQDSHVCAQSNTHIDVPEAMLQLMPQPEHGKDMPLNKTINTLGKSGEQVAAISHRRDGHYLIVIDAGEDMPPPSINNSAVDREQRLHDGDFIEVAGVVMRFRAAGNSPE